MEKSRPTAFEIARDVQAGKISAEELTVSLLNKIKTRHSFLNCFVRICEEEALIQAKHVDSLIMEKKDAGILAGVPVVVKDNILTLDSPCTAGSEILENFHPPYEATAVRKLREAGAIILGKTNLDEFGMGSSCEFSHYGPTLNPWDRSRVAGGSSGGSAAAIAAGFAPAALGSDTGGSVRQPASFCGVAGFRPTYGLVSRYGLIAFASSLDQVGPIAADTRDIALLMTAISGRDKIDSTSIDIEMEFLSSLDKDISGMKIGVPSEYISKIHNAQIEKSLGFAKDVFAGLDATVEEVSLPDPDAAIASYYVIATAEASSNLARYTGVHYSKRSGDGPTVRDITEDSRKAFGREVKRRILLGTFVLSSGYYDAYYLKAQAARSSISKAFKELFKSLDILVMPTAPTPAFKPGEKLTDPLEMYNCDIMTVAASLAGLPALSIPCGFSEDGLPLGIQIIGPRLSDALVLRAGRTFEKQTGLYNLVAPVNGEKK